MGRHTYVHFEAGSDDTPKCVFFGDTEGRGEGLEFASGLNVAIEPSEDNVKRDKEIGVGVGRSCCVWVGGGGGGGGDRRVRG